MVAAVMTGPSTDRGSVRALPEGWDATEKTSCLDIVRHVDAR
jgi:hypothetical protein